jgi:hypothetical protein
MNQPTIRNRPLIGRTRQVVAYMRRLGANVLSDRRSRPFTSFQGDECEGIMWSKLDAIILDVALRSHFDCLCHHLSFRSASFSQAGRSS